jgi:hypothetical protein
MFWVRRPLMAGASSRINAVRELYRKFANENTREARGLRLLRDWLSPDQREQFDKSGYFEVLGCVSRKRYRIYHVIFAPNVYEIDGVGRLKQGMCFLPAGPLVTGDIMLAQKIALETDEHRAIAVANRFSPARDLTRMLAREAILGRSRIDAMNRRRSIRSISGLS